MIIYSWREVWRDSEEAYCESLQALGGTSNPVVSFCVFFHVEHQLLTNIIVDFFKDISELMFKDTYKHVFRGQGGLRARKNPEKIYAFEP